jgi:EpsI family protein
MQTSLFRFIAVFVLLGSTLGALRLADNRPPESLATPLASLPKQLSGWNILRDSQIDAASLQTLSATSYLARLYRKGDVELDFFTAYYSQQKAGENMHSPKNCLPGNGWEIWQYETKEIEVGGQRVPINFDHASYEGSRHLLVYWYQSKRRIIANEYLGKLLLVRDALLEGQTSGAIVRIMVPEQPGMADEAVRFAQAMIPAVQRCF